MATYEQIRSSIKELVGGAFNFAYLGGGTFSFSTYQRDETIRDNLTKAGWENIQISWSELGHSIVMADMPKEGGE